MGNGPATNVVLHDRLPPGLKHAMGAQIDADLGTLQPGETRTVKLDTTAVQAGQFVNEASATADNTPPVTARAEIAITQPALFLSKTGPQLRFIDREADFDLDVSNPGSAPATNVRVLDTLPPGLECISATNGGTYDLATRTVTWNVGTIPPGEHRAMSIKVVGRAPGQYLNRGVAYGDRGLEAKTEAGIRVDGVPALMLEVVDLDDPIELGQETTYEIRVVNQGSMACGNLQVIATAPAGMVPRGGSGASPYRIQGQQVVFEPVDKLAPRADTTFRVRVFCKEPGDWRFKVQMSCDQLRLPVHEEESTRIYRDSEQ